MKKRRRDRARRPHDDRVREHRHDALPGPGDGAGRADAHATSRSRTRSRPTTSSSRRRRARRARCSSSSPTTTQLREWLPKLVGIQHHIAIRAAGRHAGARESPRTRSGSPARTTTADRALPQVPRSPTRRSTRSPTGPVAHRRRPPEYHDARSSSPTSSAPSSLGDFAADVERRTRADPRHAGSIPTRRCPAQQHADDAGLRPLRRATTRRSRPAADGRSCRPGSRSRSRRATPGFVLPRSGLALQHGVTCLNTPGLIDAAVPRRDQGAAREHRPDASRTRCSAATASRSS